jgi:hypothetical protein
LEQLVSLKISLNFQKTKGKFTLCVGDQTYQQNVCEFLVTNSFLVGKDVEQYLFNTDSTYDTVKIPLTSTGKCVTLNLVEFIRFKEMYHQQMYLLKLEDMLTHRGVALANSL